MFRKIVLYHSYNRTAISYFPKKNNVMNLCNARQSSFSVRYKLCL